MKWSKGYQEICVSKLCAVASARGVYVQDDFSGDTNSSCPEKIAPESK